MTTIQHKFVELIPKELEEGVLYITITYRTAVHKCVCGCGNKVVTPIHPTGWKLSYNGRTVSLSPSIGNWNFECKSHYFITNNIIQHVRKWSIDEINENREEDANFVKKFFSKNKKKKRKKK